MTAVLPLATATGGEGGLTVSSHRRALLLGILALAVAGIGVTQVSGAIPNPGDGRFYSCFKKHTGAMRVINYPKVDGCPKGQKLIDWSRSGPQGAQGVQGDQGPKGDQGPAGPADRPSQPDHPVGFRWEPILVHVRLLAVD
jgi:hypothetical protein